MKRHVAATLGAMVSLTFMVSCSSGGEARYTPSAPASARLTSPSISVTVKPAPSQDPEGGKPVLFDPCRSMGDDVIAKAGYDPATRERSDQVHTGYAFISCRFSRQEVRDAEKLLSGILDISSTNITMDQFREREEGNLSDISVNGGGAVMFRTSKGASSNVVTRGPDNSLDIGVDQFGSAEQDVCNRAQEVAAIIDTAVNGSK